MRRRSFLAAGAMVAAGYASKGYAQKFDPKSESNRVGETVSTELGSPLARFGLVSFASYVRFARVQRMPLKYEGGFEFRSVSEKVVASLADLLLGAEPITRLKSAPDQSILAQLAQAYDKRQQDIPDFLKIVREVSPPLRRVSDEQFMRYQLMISVLLRDRMKSLWEDANKLTCFFPWC